MGGIRAKIRSLLQAVQTTSDLARKADQQLRIQRELFRRSLIEDREKFGPKSLNHHEAQVFSKCGEDGIIQEIFRRIGTGGRRFVEFGVGVGGGIESNTTYLLLQGWSGLWLEGDPDGCRKIQHDFRAFVASGRIKVCEAFLTAENIASLFREEGVPAEFDLLSIDVDGNDYWLWRALADFKPRCVIIEYNPYFPPPFEWKIAYRQGRAWDGSIEFGASLSAMESLGRSLGYRLVCCEITGHNAFFIREDLCGDLFEGPFTAGRFYQPPRYHLAMPHRHSKYMEVPFAVDPGTFPEPN